MTQAGSQVRRLLKTLWGETSRLLRKIQRLVYPPSCRLRHLVRQAFQCIISCTTPVFPVLRRFRIPLAASGTPAGTPDCVNRVQPNFPIEIEED